ncbi:MAG: class I SAM-dependent methyltransferase [Bacillota bacterium]
MDRVDIIKTISVNKKAKTYLEIGVNDGFTFLKVPIWKKIAVDPSFRLRKRTILKYTIKNPANINNRYFSMRSDDFFSQKASKVFPEKIDIAFIDGLHTFRQSLTDVQNTLRYLNEGGVIIMHDCSPPDEISAYPAETLESVKETKGWKGDWCGDVWKTIPFLRATNKDLNIFVLDCDYGVGIISRGKPEGSLDLSESDISELSYNDLEKDRQGLLNMKPPEYLYEFLKLL